MTPTVALTHFRISMFTLLRVHQPILSPKCCGFESKGVFNPGIARKDGKVYMLYRAVGDLDTYSSSLGLAVSENGIDFTRVSSKSIFSPRDHYNRGAVEDPRIVEIEGEFYITYVAVPQQVLLHGKEPLNRAHPLITSGALLVTADFDTFEDWGVITPLNSDNKDVVLFPEKINGKFAMLHRPFLWSKRGMASPQGKEYLAELPCKKDDLPERPTTWLSYSDDLYTWTDHNAVNHLREEHDEKIGPGMPPLKTEKGWIMIYHRVETGAQGNVYTAKAALLDLANPSKVISRLPYDILVPEMDFEKVGFVHNVVFPTGGFIEGDDIWVYYGAGDTHVGLAKGSVKELLQEFEKHLI